MASLFRNVALYLAGVYYGWQKARLANLKAEVARTRKFLATGNIANAFEFSRLEKKSKKLEKQASNTEKLIKKIKKQWKF